MEQGDYGLYGVYMPWARRKVADQPLLRLAVDREEISGYKLYTTKENLRRVKALAAEHGTTAAFMFHKVIEYGLASLLAALEQKRLELAARKERWAEETKQQEQKDLEAMLRTG